ncbi:hypothetical protein RJ44_14955 [Alteromonas macleodii]|uniref:L-threonylcarbamoyladenylate synthase n=1 Tax=Alteromonas macleodii TaxID=28108 RepID=UPI0005803577|nr:L-threonylcarbamoyladenylate synthase [Alteromonas macleodii]KHT57724.1 hypothetical protein RJ44_14955 [Alteromonas macleodii]
MMQKSNREVSKIKKANFLSIQHAVEILDKGGLVVLPTDTNYCVFCDYRNPISVKKLYQAKKRSGKSPLLITVPNQSTALSIAGPNTTAQKLIDRFWPAPLTIVVPKSSAIPDFVVRGLNTVGIGCNKHEVLKILFDLRPVPLACSSANISKGKDPKSAQDVMRQIGSSVDLIIDAGHLDTSHASTIVDFTYDPPILARLGEFPLHLIKQVVPNINDGMTNQQYKSRTQKQVYDSWEVV